MSGPGAFLRCRGTSMMLTVNCYRRRGAGCFGGANPQPACINFQDSPFLVPGAQIVRLSSHVYRWLNNSAATAEGESSRALLDVPAHLARDHPEGSADQDPRKPSARDLGAHEGVRREVPGERSEDCDDDDPYLARGNAKRP